MVHLTINFLGDEVRSTVTEKKKERKEMKNKKEMEKKQYKRTEWDRESKTTI